MPHVKPIAAAVAGAALMLSPLAASAGSITGYLTDVRANVVTTTYGGCVITGRFTEELRTVECGAAPKAEPAPAPEAAPVPQVETVTLDAVALFDFDRSDIRPDARASLDALVSRIRATNNVKSVKVVGHTCTVGSAAYNQGLSERRAASVRAYLVQSGIDANLITSVGKGETQPVASNETREGRAQNRRVEVEITSERYISR